MMSKFGASPLAVLATVAVLSASAVSVRAADDAYMTEAKAYVAKGTAPAAPWNGPTTGPKAQPHKLVIYASADQRNGGAQGVGDGAQEGPKSSAGISVYSMARARWRRARRR